MRILLAVLKDFVIYFNVKTTYGRRHLAVLAGLIVIGLVAQSIFSKKPVEDTAALSIPEVTVLSVGEISAEARFDTIGKVEAVSEANLQSESGGRVTGVNVKIGDTVRAGQVLATIENSAQRAALVQAQGSYEAALAASAQSNVGVDDAGTTLRNAKNNAVNTCNGAYSTVNGVVLNNIDQFFTYPNGSIPGLRIDGYGKTEEVSAERIAYQQLLPAWQAKSNTLSVSANLPTELRYCRAQVQRTIDFVDLFIAIFNQPGGVNRYTDAELQGFSTQFTALRTSLIGTRAAIDNAQATLTAAESGADRARIGATGGRVSASGAQIMIALGSLQAAQSSYQKTIVRTPISGVVNAFYLKAGDYTAPGQPAGIIANNKGLQIKTFVNEVDSASLSVGDTVTIEGGATGVITAKAAALDPANGKVAIIVGVDNDSDLTNGATVKVTFAQIAKAEVSDKVLIPLSALKITSGGSFVFMVETDTLKATKVEQGQLYGNNVEILSGITKESRIVTDARGLKDGQKVTITN